MTKRKTLLSPQILSLAEKLFTRLSFDGDDTNFDHFCKRLSLLTEKEQRFMLMLTGYYYQEPWNTLLNRMQMAYQNLPLDKFQNADKILFLPMVGPTIKVHGEADSTERPETKSGQFVFELFSRNFSKRLTYNDKFNFCGKTSEVNSFYTDSSILIFMDDFIGSGETAKTTIQQVVSYAKRKHHITIPGNNICVIAPIMMEIAIHRLTDAGYQCGFYKSFKKQLSENNRLLSDFPDGVELMHSIEEKVVPKAIKLYSFGYAQSESLVTIMNKTPNNTFPFYWFGADAVFYRDNNTR